MPPSRFKPNEMIGQYHQVVRELTAADQPGEVYLCKPLIGGDYIVLKTFRDTDEGSTPHLRLRDEVRIWMSLEKHPNIVKCYGIEYIDGYPFILLEWIAKHAEVKATETADTLVEKLEGGLSFGAALAVATEIAYGLAYAQESRGLVHGDLKRENILVTDTGAKITDFGLALMEGIADRERGFNFYHAPELLEESPPSLQTDIYAFGELVFHMIMGHHPYVAKSESISLKELKKRKQANPVPPIPPRDGISVDALNSIIQCCTACVPNERYATMAEVCTELHKVYEQNRAVLGRMPAPPATQPLTAQEHVMRGFAFDYMLRIGETDDDIALAHFNEAIELAPNVPLARIFRGAYYADRGQYDLARADYNEVLARVPDDPRANHVLALAHYNLAQVLEKQDQAVDALKHYDQSIELQKRDLERYRGRATSYQELKLGDTYNERANLLVKNNHYGDAIEDYKQAIEYAPDDPELQYNLGITYYELGQYRQAIEVYNRAEAVTVGDKPKGGRIYYNRGLAKMKGGQQEASAIQDFRTAITLLKVGDLTGDLRRDTLKVGIPDASKITPIILKAYSHLGELQEKQRHIKDAEKTYTDAVDYALEQDEPALEVMFRIRLVLWCLTTRQDEDAQGHLDALNERLAKLDDTLLAVKEAKKYGYPITLEMMKQRTGAVSSTSSASTVLDSIKHLLKRGFELMDQGQFEAARDTLSDIIAKDSSFVDGYVNRGKCHYMLKHFDAASRDFDRALELNPDYAEVYFNLGSIAAQDNSGYETAITEFEKALELFGRGSYDGQIQPETLKPGANHPRATDYQSAVNGAYRRLGELQERLRRVPAAGRTYQAALDFCAAWGNRDEAMVFRFQLMVLYLLAGLDDKAKPEIDRLNAQLKDAQGESAQSIKDFGYPFSLETRAHKLPRQGQSVVSTDILLGRVADAAKQHFLDGHKLASQGRHEQAVSEFTRALNLTPDFVEAYVERAAAYLATNRPQQALDDYNKGLALKPNYFELYYNRGLCCQLIGNLDLAIYDYRTTIAEKPDYAPAYFNLGIVLQEKGHFEEALVQLHQAASMGVRQALGAIPEVQAKRDRQTRQPIPAESANDDERQAQAKDIGCVAMLLSWLRGRNKMT